MEAVYVPTMTVKQAYDRMRSVGIRTSEQKIRAMIDAGQYPWAISCMMNQREYEIYKVLFDKWLAERSEPIDENFTEWE